jgi:very-long-chain ceramide synthase
MAALSAPYSLPEWVPSFLEPFLVLSYPVEPPKNPDSFTNSRYYRDGPKDLCFMVTCILVMAILRDALRLAVFEPFARWKLNRDALKRLRKSSSQKQGNGHANGHSNGHANGHSTNTLSVRDKRRIERSVLRFAEQGWSAVYYPAWWCFGFVRVFYHFAPIS